MSSLQEDVQAALAIRNEKCRIARDAHSRKFLSQTEYVAAIRAADDAMCKATRAAAVRHGVDVERAEKEYDNGFVANRE